MLNTCLTVRAWSVSVAVIVDDDLNNLRQVGNNEIAERDKKRQSEISFSPHRRHCPRRFKCIEKSLI